MKKPFRAVYEGWCPMCHKRIEEGDWVVYGDDNKVVHKTCDDEDDEA